MTELTETPRSIETEIELDAPVEAVWKALTDAEELTNWFPPRARIKPGRGGSVWVSWGEGMEWETPIDAWEDNRHLRLIYAEPTAPAREGDDPPVFVVPFRVAVDYHLEARGGGTVLRLVHSGFSRDAAWDGQYDGTVRGWAFELRGLKHYLERHRGTKRVVVHAKHDLDDVTIQEAWKRLMSQRGMVAEGRLEGLGKGDRYALRMATGDRLKGAIHILNPPRDLCATVENLNDALLRLRLDEACMTVGRREVNFWLSTFGLSRRDTDELQKRAIEMLEDLYGGER